jgi:hypothetical protein
MSLGLYRDGVRVQECTRLVALESSKWIYFHYFEGRKDGEDNLKDLAIQCRY